MWSQRAWLLSVLPLCYNTTLAKSDILILRPVQLYKEPTIPQGQKCSKRLSYPSCFDANKVEPVGPMHVRNICVAWRWVVRVFTHSIKCEQIQKSFHFERLGHWWWSISCLSSCSRTSRPCHFCVLNTLAKRRALVSFLKPRIHTTSQLVCNEACLSSWCRRLHALSSAFSLEYMWHLAVHVFQLTWSSIECR